MSEAYEGSRRCINCDAVLTGAYCAECGQDNRARRLGFRAISADLSALLLNLEIPIVRTVVGLTWRPGWVCAEYVGGRRRTFTNPLKYCFITGALLVALFGLLEVHVPMLPPGAAERASAGPDGEAFRTQALPMIEWFGRYMHILLFVTLPVLALLMRVFFRSSGRTVIEHYVLGLYVYGHCFLLQLFVIPLGGAKTVPAYAVFKLLPFVYFSWAAIVFCRAKIWRGLILSLAAHFAYLCLMVAFGLVVGLIYLQFR